MPAKQEMDRAILTPMLEQLILERNKEERVQNKEKLFRASSLGYCDRQVLYKLKGLEDEKTGIEYFTLNLGTAVHEVLQAYIAGSSMAISSEDEITVEEIPNTTGHYDYLLQIGEKRVLLEIKTCNVEAFERLALRPLPYESHKLQATFYMLSLEVDDAIFLYVNKNGMLTSKFARENPGIHPLFLEIPYKLEQKCVDKIVEITYRRKHHYDTDTMPEYKAISQCTYCPAKIKDQCKIDRKLEKKARKESNGD